MAYKLTTMELTGLASMEYGTAHQYGIWN